MAIDSVWLGPMWTQYIGGPWQGTTADPGVMTAGFAYDSATGDFARDSDGHVFHVAAMVTVTAADFADTTDLRARLVTEIAAQFVALNAIPPGTTLTPIWTDYTPPPPPEP